MDTLQEQINRLQAQLNELQAQFYKNNFSSSQTFNKSSTFTVALKVPVYTVLPSCEEGQVCAFGGKLMIASAKNVWTVVGTQS